MVYRVLIGVIPLMLAALLFSGAIPVSSVVGSGAVHRPAAQAAVAATDLQSPTPPEMVTNPKEASQLFDSVDASLDAEIKRRAPEEKKRKERLQRQRMEAKGQAGWAPEEGGWGS